MLCFGHLLGLGLATFSFTGEPFCAEVPVRAERLTAEAVTDSSRLALLSRALRALLMAPQSHSKCHCRNRNMESCRVQNSSWPLAIFRAIFYNGHPNFINFDYNCIRWPIKTQSLIFKFWFWYQPTIRVSEGRLHIIGHVRGKFIWAFLFASVNSILCSERPENKINFPCLDKRNHSSAIDLWFSYADLCKDMYHKRINLQDKFTSPYKIPLGALVPFRLSCAPEFSLAFSYLVAAPCSQCRWFKKFQNSDF